jgi:hypothetical protein
MQAGRVNRAENFTRIWAQSSEDQQEFQATNTAILIVEVAKDFEDEGTGKPPNNFSGLMATGWSGGSAATPKGALGAHGIIGRGGARQGTGVVGLGGGTPEKNLGGAGGIGVHGLGGPADEAVSPVGFGDAPPGAGVVGQEAGRATSATLVGCHMRPA